MPGSPKAPLACAAADTFKQRVGSLRKALKSRCEFVFLDAPFHAVPFNTEELQENGGGDAGRSWCVHPPGGDLLQRDELRSCFIHPLLLAFVLLSCWRSIR